METAKQLITINCMEINHRGWWKGEDIAQPRLSQRTANREGEKQKRRKGSGGRGRQ